MLIISMVLTLECYIIKGEYLQHSHQFIRDQAPTTTCITIQYVKEKHKSLLGAVPERLFLKILCKT